MKKVTSVVLLLIVLGVPDVILFPSHEWRAVRSPYTQNTFMLSSLNPPPSYVPENFMTSFGGGAGGEAISTNTYGEPETFDTEQEDVITEIRNQSPEPQLEQKPPIEEAAVTEQPSPQTKKKPEDKNLADGTGKGAVDDADDDDGDSPWPFLKDPRRSYNAFFPIVIGGYPDARGLSRSSGENPSGSATAIANSFSTGRGGVASSHATSFGDPYLSMLLRNAIFKRRNLSEKDE